MKANLAEKYAQMVSSGQWRDNSAQKQLVDKLSLLDKELRCAHNNNAKFVQKFIAGIKKILSPNFVSSPYAQCELPGIYIYGRVGTGKTQLMDFFWEDLEGFSGLRLHFYEFMAEVHRRIAIYRANRSKSNTIDPVEAVGSEIAAEYGLICLDELFVDDIADAMILGRLFEAMLKRGAKIVCTSNCHINELYEDGLHRDRFLPFIKLLKNSLDTFELDAEIDYRSLLKPRTDNGYVVIPSGDGEASEKTANKIWQEIKALMPATKETSYSDWDDVKHADSIKIDDHYKSSAKVSFRNLCEGAYGASNYTKMLDEFNLVMITDVEQLVPDIKNLARRFVTFIDIAYEKRTRLVITSSSSLRNLAKESSLKEAKRMCSRIHALTSTKQ